MIQRGIRVALEVVAGVLAVLVLLVVVALWRLSTGPVPLDFLTPRIEAALADPEGDFSVRIGNTELTWGGWAKTVDLHTRNVEIRDREGVALAALPDVVIRLSLRALVQGTVAPTRVEVTGARLSLVRRRDGGFEFGHGNGQAGDALVEADFSRVLPSVIEQLLSKPAPDRPLSFLSAVRIIGGRVSVDDRKLSLAWEAPYADIELRRDSAGLAGDVALAIDLGKTRANVTGGFLYDRGTDRIDLSVRFTELHPEAMASVIPQLELRAGLTTPLDGSVSASMGVDGAVDWLRFDITGGAGELMLPGVLPATLPLQGLTLRGRVSGPERRVELERATLNLGTRNEPGPEISATGSLTSTGRAFGGDLDVEAELTATNLAVEDFARYWPRDVAVGAQSWVLRNVTHGWVDEASMQAALHIPNGKIDEMDVGRLGGTLRYHDVEVHYLRPLPPLTAISGTAVFDHAGMTFSAENGRGGDLEIRPSTVEITGLDSADQRMAIELAAVGPLGSTLELLDHERLGLIHGLGIDPAATDGQVAARVEFGFPLLKDLSLADLSIAAKADLEQVTVKEFLLGQDAAKGSISLALDKTGMVLRGPLELGGVAMEIVWNESFTPEAPQRTKLEVQIDRIGESGRKTFGLDLAPYLEGPVSASVLLSVDHGGRGRVEATVNLQDARLAFAPLAWAKPRGVEGEAALAAEMVEQRLIALSALDISAGTMRARGTGEFDETGRAVASLALDDLAFDRTSLTGVSIDWRGEGLDVRIGGGVLDAAPFLDGDETEDVGEERTGPENKAAAAGRAAEDGTGDQAASADKAETGGAATAEPDTRVFTPLNLSAPRLEAVYFAPDRFLEGVSLDLVRSPRGWQRIGVSGRVPRALWSPEPPARAAGQARRNGVFGPNDRRQGEGEAEVEPPPKKTAPPAPVERILNIDFGPKPGGGYGFLVTAQDMGAVLRALDRLDTINGGRVEIVGQSGGPLPGHPLKARIEAHDYVMVEAPVLARLATIASLTGVVDLLNGEGIRFDRLVGEFTLRDGVLETELIRAHGPALGLTAKGEIDFAKSVTNLQGTVIPAYTLNRILGEIPLLGPLLTGGKGEGLLAVTYRMTGDLEDPDVSVNPLSVLAPGFLRGLFNGGGGDGDQPRALPERSDP